MWQIKIRNGVKMLKSIMLIKDQNQFNLERWKKRIKKLKISNNSEEEVY
jgi:hypothetical protein